MKSIHLFYLFITLICSSATFNAYTIEIVDTLGSNDLSEKVTITPSDRGGTYAEMNLDREHPEMSVKISFANGGPHQLYIFSTTKNARGRSIDGFLGTTIDLNRQRNQKFAIAAEPQNGRYNLTLNPYR